MDPAMEPILKIHGTVETPVNVAPGLWLATFFLDCGKPGTIQVTIPADPHHDEELAKRITSLKVGDRVAIDVTKLEVGVGRPGYSIHCLGFTLKVLSGEAGKELLG